MSSVTPLSSREMGAFALPSVLIFLYRASVYVIPALYAERFNFHLADIAAILFTMRTVEALLQIPAGMLSDATRHPRWGRKPMIFACIIAGGGATYQIYTPPADAGMVFFSLWLSVATIAGSISEVAYGAWSTEITDDYRERARCASYQSWAQIAGKEIFSMVPLLWFLSSSRINFESLQVMAWILAALVPLVTWISWRFAPVGKMFVSTEQLPVAQMLSIIMHNRPMQLVLMIVLLWETGVSFSFSVDFMRIDSYLKAGESIPYQGLVGVWAAMAGLTTLAFVLKRYEKHRVWAISIFFISLIFAAQLMLSPGMSGLVPILIGISILTYGIAAAAVVVPLSLMGDLADYESLRSGNRAAGPIVAIIQLSYKLAGGGASAAGLYIVSLFGFKPGQPSYGTSEALGIQIVALGLPAALLLLASLLAWRYPITERRHKGILRAIARREKRAG